MDLKKLKQRHSLHKQQRSRGNRQTSQRLESIEEATIQQTFMNDHRPNRIQRCIKIVGRTKNTQGLASQCSSKKFSP